jgi:hypothetical protein
MYGHLKPLNIIALEQREIDIINWLIIVTGYFFIVLAEVLSKIYLKNLIVIRRL